MSQERSTSLLAEPVSLTRGPGVVAERTAVQDSGQSRGEELASATDEVLLRAFAARREEAAFRALVERHGGMVFGVALRVLHDRHRAEDVLQATFLVLAREPRRVRRPAALAGWLHGVARRIALRVLRHEQRRSEESLSEVPVMQDSTLDGVGAVWERQVLDEELQALPEAWREPLLLHELEGLSCSETAERLGITVTALEGRLKRGRKELRHRLLRRGIGAGAVLAAVQCAAEAAGSQPGAAALLATVETSLHSAAADVSGMASAGQMTPQYLAHQELCAMSVVKTSVAVTVAGSLLLTASLLGGGWRFVTGASASPPSVPLGGPVVTTLVEKGAVDVDAGNSFTSADAPQAAEALTAADRVQFIRRVALDLTGQPPTPDEVTAFRDDPRPFDVAAAALIERLVGSQAHVERVKQAGQNRAAGGQLVGESPWQATDYRQIGDNEARILMALDEKADVEFIDTELKQVLDYLADRYHIPIVPDESSLTAIGIGLDTQVNYVISSVSLESVLNHILRQQGLDYIIRDEVLEITSREDADRFMETRVYELNWLPSEIRPEDVARVIARNIHPASWGQNPWVYWEPTASTRPAAAEGGYGSGDPGMMGAIPPPAKPVQKDAPATAIEPLPGCLVITQSQRAHREIRDLLDQLSRRPQVSRGTASSHNQPLPSTERQTAPASNLNPLPTY